MPDFSNAVVSVVSGIWKRAKATGQVSVSPRSYPLKWITEGRTFQGGLLSGVDPSAFTTSDPLRLWIIQMGEHILFKVYDIILHRSQV
jgi:hypothetical protein